MATPLPPAPRRAPVPGGPPPAPSVIAPATSGQIWDAVRILVRHRWWALAGFLLFSAPVAWVTLTTTPVYRATTRLLVSEDKAAVVGLGGARDQEEPSPALSPRTQSEVVRSRGLVRETVESLRLWEAPEFGALVADAATDADRAQRLVDPFLERLLIDVSPDSPLIIVSFEATDPAVAARAVNALAAGYIERDRESRFKAATDATAWLTRRLAEQRQQVSTSETALQTYRERNDALSLEDRQNITVQKLSDLNTAVTKAKTDRIVKEALVQQLDAVAGNTTALETHPLIAANAFVQSLKSQVSDLTRQEAQLSEKYGPRHPEMIQVRTALTSVQAKLRTEIGHALDAARTDYRAAQAQELSLTRALDAQKTEALALDRKGVEYAALAREAVSARQVFDALLQQTKEAALTSDLQKSGMRVVDEAEVPGAPVRPLRRQGLVAALALGLLGGLGLAFGRDYLRTRIASPHDVERHLGLPVLALIPAGKPTDVDRIGELSPPAAEAFRRLRTSVLVSAEGVDEGHGQVLVVTSTAPKEGKTVVAAHLASILAAADQRVVLIDADLRRPRLHTLFGRERSPGLTEMLAGKNKIDVVALGDAPGPALVPSGAATPQASELLSLHTFKQFVDSLRTRFDWIVIDSPPVMAVTDAAILAHDATAVLLVTCADRTSLEAAEAAVGELTAVGAQLIGAVLNRAPLTREAYYYSRYYRPEYREYFGAQVRATVNGSGEAKRPSDSDVVGRTVPVSGGGPLSNSVDPSP